MLFVHAHPDDETLTTGGTIATLRSRGVDVRVVTCTLGEEGEVLGDEWSGLVADGADQLGGYRIGELRGALLRLGVDRPRFLGGAGRWRDSGMIGTPSAEHPRAFVGSGDEAVSRLVEILDEFGPDVVVTYDPVGGYGHPDHIRAHEIVHRAAAECAHPPARLAWTVTGADDVTRRHPGPVPPLREAAPGELPSVPETEITHVVRLGDEAFRAKVDALGYHATQLRVDRAADRSYWFSLTNHVLQTVPARECYICLDRGADGKFARCAPGDDDLLAGLSESDR